jgi:hypothetical protein
MMSRQFGLMETLHEYPKYSGTPNKSQIGFLRKHFGLAVMMMERLQPSSMTLLL